MDDTNHTARSDVGLLLPYSGLVLGQIADALKIKHEIDVVDAGDKTVQRYFSGTPVEPETIPRILDAIVAAVVPNDIPLPVGLAPPGATFPGLVRAALGAYCTRWDRLAAAVNQHRWPVPPESAAGLAIGPLRLTLLDLGLRWGCWSALLGEDMKETKGLLPWWSDTALGRMIDAYRPGRKPTVEKLSAACKVTPQAFELWRSGKSLPSNNNLKFLAKKLVDGDLAAQRRLEYKLRLVAGTMSLRRALAKQCGGPRIDDMLAALQRTAELVSHNLVGNLRLMLSDEAEPLRHRIWTTVLVGAHSELGATLCEALANEARWSQEVQADFVALPGDWERRCAYWMHMVGTRARKVAAAREAIRTGKLPAVSRLTPEQAVDFDITHAMRMREFDFKPGNDWHGVLIKNPPDVAAHNRAVQAERALSAGDLDTALVHWRRCVELQPLDPIAHFKLGATLGMLGAAGREEAFTEALFEVRLAVEMDPKFGNARNEIAVILSNMWRREEAEVAFAEAEPHHGHHSHHWFGRANNLVGLGRLEQAAAAYKNAIERSAQNDHLDATVALALTLMALGRDNEARRWHGKVRTRVPEAVLGNWRQFLQGWQIRRR